MIRLATRTVIAGFLSHFTKYILDEHVHREGWHRLSSYSLGIVLLFPSVRAFYVESLLRMDVPPEMIRRMELGLFLSYFGAAVFFGFGTATGWLVYDGTGRGR